MITVYLDKENFKSYTITAENKDLLQKSTWIDLFLPSKEEKELVEKCVNVHIPTRDEMVEIELSNRFYKEDNNLFMTATMVAQSDHSDYTLDPVTCLLTQKNLITVRHVEPQSFKIFLQQLKKHAASEPSAVTAFILLLESNVNALADILEAISHRLDDYSKQIFYIRNPKAPKPNYRRFMRFIGTSGDANTKVRESLVTFNRVVQFFTNIKISEDDQMRLAVVGKDVNALSDHATFMSNKIIFLLEATLGMVNIDQNNIIKIFSVAAVIFLPPTLIASIYGMNFNILPELAWEYGYFFALGLMIISSWSAYRYFKWKKWL